MISKTKSYILFNKENYTYNDNNNYDYNGLFVTCCSVETVCSITDAEEFSKNIQGYRSLCLQIWGSQGLRVTAFWSCFSCCFVFIPTLLNTFARLKRYRTCSDSLANIQSNVQKQPLRGVPRKKVFWKYAANLQEYKANLLKSHFGMGVLL